MNNTIVIGIAGPAQSGKTTAAHMIHTFLFDECGSGHDFVRTCYIASMADPLKEAVRQMMHWDERHTDGPLKDKIDPFWGFSPRTAMQRLGTEWGRGLRDDIWVKSMEQKMLSAYGKFLIIPDIRFENEAAFVRERGILLHIDPGLRKTASVDAHVSEAGVARCSDDYVIPNEESEVELELNIDNLFYDLKEDWIREGHLK